MLFSPENGVEKEFDVPNLSEESNLLNGFFWNPASLLKSYFKNFASKRSAKIESSYKTNWA